MELTIICERIVAEPNPMRKAKLLKKVKESISSTGFRIIDICHEVFESERTVYRLLSLNNLIPEFQQMFEEGQLTKLKAYHLSSCDPNLQVELYHNLHYKEFLEVKTTATKDYLRKFKERNKTEAIQTEHDQVENVQEQVKIPSSLNNEMLKQLVKQSKLLKTAYLKEIVAMLNKLEKRQTYSEYNQNIQLYLCHSMKLDLHTAKAKGEQLSEKVYRNLFQINYPSLKGLPFYKPLSMLFKSPALYKEWKIESYMERFTRTFIQPFSLFCREGTDEYGESFLQSPLLPFERDSPSDKNSLIEGRSPPFGKDMLLIEGRSYP